MKHLSFLLSDTKKYKTTKAMLKKNSYSSELIQLFTSLTNKSEIESILLKLKNDFPNAIVIGATTAGEISHAKMHENSTVLSFTLFKKTKLTATYVKSISAKSAKELSQTLSKKETKAAIVLSEGLNGEDYEGFIEGIKKANPKLLIAGGLAGDNFKLKKTYVFLGEKVYKKGAVGVSFSGKDLFADNKYNLNWTPIGKEFTLTSTEGNLLKTIDDENAISVYKKYLGENIFKDGARELSNFQLLYQEGSTTVSRTPMAVKGDALVFAAPLKKGQKVQFGFSNASSVISGSQEISKEIQNKTAQAIFIYSCIARKTLLGKTLEKEFKEFEDIAPTSGFFTYGEFYSTTVDNALLNCTTTILILSEESKSSKKRVTKRIQEKKLDSSTFTALTHFIEQTSQELDENLTLLNEYKDVVDASSLVTKTDKKGIITYANENFCRTSKYKREEVIGKNHNIVRDKKSPNSLFKKMWSTILSGRIWKGLLSNRAKDNSIYYVNVTVMPIMDTHGKIKEFIAIRQDVTKEMESKQRLKEKEQLIKAIFDNQDSIVLFSSKTEGMISSNKKLFHYLDFKNFEDFRSKHDRICNLFIEEEGYIYPSKYPNWIDDAVESKAENEQKAKIKTKDGKVRTFNIMVKKIDDEYIINLYDITKLENAIFKANSSEQAKSLFLANMSHEIRTPLNGILGFTDVLTKKELDKDAKRYVDIIHKSGQTLLNVVNDILDFSKIESGELTLYQTESDLFKEMEATVATFASLSKQNSIDYYIYIDTTIPKSLKCDVQRIKQVTNNLVSNAIKFTPKGGHVSVEITLVSLSKDKAKIKFSVKDSGIGIAKEKLKTIFHAFSQADDSISKEFGGTGLGLSISSQYIKMMDSKLKVNSELDKGSEFHFTLELPVLNQTHSITKVTSKKFVNIAVLKSEDRDCCIINDIVYTYLETWQFPYTKVTNLQEIADDTNILIVPAKLFDKKSCQEILEQNSELELIYIEGSQEQFDCSNERFHFIEQPMTGSSLFDKLITINNQKNGVTQKKSLLDETETKQYSGNILIAEDNGTNQMLISLLLEERGIDYTIANNGQEALEYISKDNDKYDLIFMDINMPILDGISTTKLLREKNYTKPIVSLSANVIESDILSFKEAGVDDSLHKPLIPKELDVILDRYLKERGEPELSFVFDSIDLNRLSKHLAIADTNLVAKLLRSFVSSAQSILQKLELNDIDKDITHNLKGLSGNFKFDLLYDLVCEYENTLEQWQAKEHIENKKTLVAHLSKIIEKIDAIS
ncbi:MAG: FIST N-terminal domain-containing protein [Campylobacterota bacterium]|nr:FIST N-terminal domain-containing protein [Campylobacterota bacterium]